MSDVMTTRTPAERARALFAAEELPFPPMPAEISAQLREVAPHVYATRDLEDPPYNLEVYSLEVQETAVPNYAVVGFDGHGTNSWAAHYFLVDDALALFIQLPWGGAYHDPDKCRSAITAAFNWAGTLQANIRDAKSQGLIPAGWRLLVVVSRFAEPGWAWIPSPPMGPESVEWHPGANLRAATDKVLADLKSGNTKLG